MIDQETINEIIRRIVDVARPDRIVLFGSAARGEAREESDIDLLVVKKGVSHRRRLAQEIYVSLIGIPVPVDVIVVTPEDVEELKDAIGTIIPAALTEGIEIYAA
jgi:predicted nucleotidyltransferase